MKVFISSIIKGFEPFREAANRAVTALRHKAIRAEDFGASVRSPQSVCLEGVRQADLTIVILGAGYGAIQPTSGLSATHEEFREARDRCPILIFVQKGVVFDPQQQDFVREVQ